MLQSKQVTKCLFAAGLLRFCNFNKHFKMKLRLRLISDKHMQYLEFSKLFCKGNPSLYRASHMLFQEINMRSLDILLCCSVNLG